MAQAFQETLDTLKRLLISIGMIRCLSHRCNESRLCCGFLSPVNNTVKHPHSQRGGLSADGLDESLFIPPQVKLFHEVHQRTRHSVIQSWVLLHEPQNWLNTLNANIGSGPRIGQLS